MYAYLFQKLMLKIEKLSPHEGSNMSAFNGTITRPWGYLELMVTLEKGKDTVTSDLQYYLVVPYKNAYNYILGC